MRIQPSRTMLLPDSQGTPLTLMPCQTAVRQGIDFLVSDKAVRADNEPGRHAGNHRFLDNPGRIFSNFPHLHSAGKVIQDGNGHRRKPHRDCLEDAAERTE